jgi:DeoR/GlpR family transcriptional regulator of sugar metabolism
MQEDKPMFLQERQESILKELNECGKVKVKTLSSRFGVTEDCIRKDLKLLENEGKLKRTYGGAILSKDYPLQRDVIDRRMVHTTEKQKIAEKATAMIKDHETIFLDISTTNIKIAQLLAAQHRTLIVVSNMIDILQTLAGVPQITVIGTGGTMYRTTNGFMGIATARAIEEYSFDRAFIGSCGIDVVDSSITTLGAEDGLTKMAAIRSSRHKYIVMESEKFYYNECYKFAHFDDVDGIISDKMPNAEMQKILEAAGVELY